MNKAFNYMGKVYVWHDNKLYRLPYCVNNKWYNLLQCKRWRVTGFYLGASKKSKLQVKAMLRNGFDIEFKIEQFEDMPF
jgi:hypothetical protein